MLLFIIILFLIYGIFIEPYQLEIKRYQIRGIADLKICFFSDCHFGRLYDIKNLDRIVKMINATNSDMVIFGGDFFDYYDHDKAYLDDEYLANRLNDINCINKIAVIGNHDYADMAYEHFVKVFSEAGFKILINEDIIINDIVIKGIDDMYNGDVGAYIDRIYDKYTIALAHEPDTFDKYDIKFDLAISGHSHGGQIALPIIKAIIRNNGARKYNKGMYNINGNKLIVSSGIGMTKLPIRFMNKPQIVLIQVGEYDKL